MASENTKDFYPLDHCNITEPDVVLYQVTNHVLNEAAKATNKYIELGKASNPRKPYIPAEIKYVPGWNHTAMLGITEDLGTALLFSYYIDIGGYVRCILFLSNFLISS